MKPRNVSSTCALRAEPFDLKDLTPELRKFWREKVAFNMKALRLNKKKAKEWASRTVRILKDDNFEF